ncbi:hypothetical protein EPI11_02640 [Flavobacterium cerinum]|uniref:Uncharacterized protein n=1 Tax=Flavobacterium cerinum TaxID=2502784 RepID=A0A444HG11_9FLAO|nr:hypothetical protein EPI11_02640 [Flavobacterium cerinum]
MLAKPVIPVLDYVINYEYIAKELCENKAKPQMHCNGKCHLMKELAKAAENEKPASQKKAQHQEAEVLFCEMVADFSFSTNSAAVFAKNVTGYSNLYSHLNTTAVFHPPAFIS